MKRFIFSALLSSAPLLAKDNTGCPQIDVSKKYSDGIPYCPDSVKDNAFTVTRCAFDQAKDWHASKPAEEKLMMGLVQSLKDGDAAKVLVNSDQLKLQVCRSEKDGDKFLLMYTKPGVHDYSGPFLMFREGGKDSGVVIHAPHDGQDGTNRSTRDAFQNSNALALISNGHRRTISGRIPSQHGETNPFPSDWAHTRSDLGYTAFLAFKNKYPESVHLHIHGLAANRVMVTDSVGWDSPHLLRGAFITAFNKAIKGREGFDVVAWRFNGWVTGQAMTQKEDGKGRAANERWVGAEIATRLHANTNVLTKAVRFLEEDYLKKPRAVQVDLDKEVTPDPLDLVDPAELKTDEMPEDAPDEVQPMNDDLVLAATPVKYVLPKKKPIVGIKTLACVGISYNQPINDYVTADHCKDLAQHVADFYERNSRGKVKFQVAGYHMDYDGDAWKTFGAAEQVAIKKFKANYYIIPSIFRKGGNHASGGIAHTIQFTGWVNAHEVGHLLGLGHTGIYVYDKAGKPELQPYNDKDSVMGNSGSKFLTAPQYYMKDWLRADEVALYDPAVPYYEVRRISDLNGKGLATVVVVGQNERPLFLSFPPSCKKPCVALHLAGGGGSQRVGIAGDEFYDEVFTQAHVKVLDGAPAGKVRFKLDFAPKPAAFANRMAELEEPIQEEPVSFEGDDDHEGEASAP